MASILGSIAGSVAGIVLAYHLAFQPLIAGSVDVQQSCGCVSDYGCAPDDVGSGDLSGTLVVCFKTGDFDEAERTFLISGGSEWNAAAIDVYLAPMEASDADPGSNGNCDIGIWRESLSQGLAEASPNDGWIKILPSFVSSNEDHWANLGMHEFGHLFGFGDLGTQCEGQSIMTTDIGWFWNDLPNLRGSDFYAAIRNYLNYVDDDCDGAWVEDDSDCDDADNCKYVSACDTNPSCDGQDPWPGWSDYNCDDINDVQQTEDICGGGTPIVVDPSGDGFRLTGRNAGVMFDLAGTGRPVRIPWTDPAGDDVWLALDRNGNGTIDDGTELFGDVTPQPPTSEPHGFLALGVFDGFAAGGNGDSWIDRRDWVFSHLHLWRDGNQDGISQAGELLTLTDVGIAGLSLRYQEARRMDEWGNWFRYRALVRDERGRDVGMWAYDVFFSAPSTSRPGQRRIN